MPFHAARGFLVESARPVGVLGERVKCFMGTARSRLEACSVIGILRLALDA